MKLLELTKIKITKDKNDENVPNLEITGVVCNMSIVILSTIIINKIQEFYTHLFLINCLVNF